MEFNYKNKSKLHYEVYGDGMPILLIHGLGCDMELMKECHEQNFNTNKKYKRFYIDLPGMGDSSSELFSASADGIKEIVLSFIDKYITEPFLLVGESFGGYLARGILSERSQQIKGVFLLCPVIYPDHNHRNIPLEIETDFDDTFLNTLDKCDYDEFTYYGIACNETTYRRYKRSIATGLHKANAEYIKKLESNYSLSNNPDSIIYDKPAYILCGKQDRAVGYTDHNMLLKKYSNAELVVLNHAGHNLQIEQPQLFNDAFQKWLSSIEQKSYIC